MSGYDELVSTVRGLGLMDLEDLLPLGEEFFLETDSCAILGSDGGMTLSVMLRSGNSFEIRTRSKSPFSEVCPAVGQGTAIKCMSIDGIVWYFDTQTGEELTVSDILERGIVFA